MKATNNIDMSKKLIIVLGVPEEIPANMMHSMLPAFGTIKDNWVAEAKGASG